jgi:hypothetical protein
VRTQEHWFPSHQQALRRAQCLELPASHQVGRVILSRHLRSRRASFEVNDHYEYNDSRWSVLVRGDATHVESGDLPDADNRPVAWTEGRRTFHAWITTPDITVRRLLPG